ncbi:GTPase IMAP family member 8 [Anabarilius grahami]|uniref:GTPase IMAP family member 8 n=1 Tax=Anabarilius grahami TaxID=495550 RepID=A0A3N0XZN3_ANAGA|nr:GTPase IMAP family member 8 [Anabarilius grahami]
MISTLFLPTNPFLSLQPSWTPVKNGALLPATLNNSSGLSRLPAHSLTTSVPLLAPLNADTMEQPKFSTYNRSLIPSGADIDLPPSEQSFLYLPQALQLTTTPGVGFPIRIAVWTPRPDTVQALPFDLQMNDLRIVLLGKNVSENNQVGNIILGTTVFHNEAPSSSSQQHSVRFSGTVEKRNLAVINTPHLFQSHLLHHEITQRVTECVSWSAPGPHVIILVLQYNDFSEQDRHRVIYVLKLFSEKAIKHTIVLTTDEETRTAKLASIVMNNTVGNFKWAPMVINNSITKLIKECGGGHLKFDKNNAGWRSEMIKRIEDIRKEEHEEFLICDMYEDGSTSVDNNPSSSGGLVRDGKKDGKLNQSTKTGSDGGGITSGKTKLNIVLCGYNTTLKNSVSKMIRGKPQKESKPQKERKLQKEIEKDSKVCVKKEEKIHGRQITVIELPALTRLSEEEVMRETLNCVSLCDPGVHHFILVTPVFPLTNEDKAEMEKITRIFYSNEHFMVLFTSDLTVDKNVSDFVSSTETQKVVSLYGSWYNVMGLKDQRNSVQIPDLLDCIDTFKIKPYSLQMYMRAPENRVRHELEEKLSVRENEIKELQEKIKTLAPEGVKLNLVVCGSDRTLKSFISNLILNQRERGSELSTECVRRDVKVCEHLISLVELPALFNTQLSEEEVMRQTLRCVSLCDPGVHVFIIIIPDAPINNEDRAEMEKIQKIFSSRIKTHIMVLIKQNSEEKITELNEETQSVIESFGGRHDFIGPNTQVSMLMEKLMQMFEENGRGCFSTETLLEAQMEKLQKFEEMKTKIHSLETWFQSKGSRLKSFSNGPSKVSYSTLSGAGRRHHPSQPPLSGQ